MDALGSALQIAAALVTFEAAVFLAASGLGLTPETIAKLASTKYGWNAEVVRSIAQQSAYTKTGIALLCLAVGIQFATLSSFSVTEGALRRPAAWLIAAIVGTVAAAAALLASRRGARRLERLVTQILDEKRLNQERR